ncbi:MAG: response regulator [Verrucomicrobia bacterium]|jgi:CheY-like chemotaxis protein|nr:response regulator [Verrucomicrobiota bacterium]
MPRILIAEDDPNNIEILTDLLSDEGYALAIATTREEVLRLAASELPDLILMDVQMPDSTSSDELNREAGLEATRALKENEVTRRIPVIALTAHNMLHQKERILGAGCDDLQAKPYDFDALLATIGRHLRKPSP